MLSIFRPSDYLTPLETVEAVEELIDRGAPLEEPGVWKRRPSVAPRPAGSVEGHTAQLHGDVPYGAWSKTEPGAREKWLTRQGDRLALTKSGRKYLFGEEIDEDIMSELLGKMACALDEDPSVLFDEEWLIDAIDEISQQADDALRKNQNRRRSRSRASRMFPA